MSQPKSQVLRFTSFAGGLNDTDPPHLIGETQLQEAQDVELTQSGGVMRRPGIALAMGPPSTSLEFQLLSRHTPTQALTATEVWAFAINSANFHRSASGTTWTSTANNDASANANLTITDSASFNGKLYIAYKKAASTDRLNVWDGTSVRRVGISTPAAPTAADTGTGSYAATVRYYKVQFSYADASSKYTFSDLSAALTFTPSGTGTHARITKPATVDGATRWRIWGSADNVSYFLLVEQAIGTTTYDDNAAPSTYATTNLGVNYLPAESGEFTPPWSAKYLLVDENRLMIAGAFETSRYASRVGWSSIIGTAARQYGETVVVSDDERFPTNFYLDLDSDEGGEITGMEMLMGSVFVFKRWGIYKLVRTGSIEAPYKPVTISKTIGAISRRSIVSGEDATGNPCLYFLSERGPYRLGTSGVEYIGRNIETTWRTVRKRGYVISPHGVYDPMGGHVRWWVPTTLTVPDKQLLFHVKQNAWTTTASTSKGMCVASSAMLPSDLSNRDSDLVPHAIHSFNAFSYPCVVWKYITAQTQDDTVDASGVANGAESFSGSFLTKTIEPFGIGQRGGVRDVYVLCRPTDNNSPALAVSLHRDFEVETRSKTQSFTAATARLPQQIHDLTMAQAQYLAVEISSATQQNWTVDEVGLRIGKEEPV